ncbi:MAG: ribonuclease HI [Flavobacteriales bacterium]|nr:ribonuclease HI [Flavobacteriales bacterium]
MSHPSTESLPFIELFTDGGAEPNPGIGGFGFILCQRGHCKEFAQGFEMTTNNRMELMAVIYGLAQIKRRTRVQVYSDSKYVIDGIEKGWAKNWRSKGWMRNSKEKALNADLWARLLELVDHHEVRFQWVKGHNGHMQNERCDALATWAIKNSELRVDEGYPG